MNHNVKFNQITEYIEQFKKYHKSSIPLCAAENIMSSFTKIPLQGDFQERYIMGSQYDYLETDNFIGSKYLVHFYSLLSEVCERLFEAKYTDARTLSGMNCITTVLMALTQIGDKIALLPADWGGHASMKPVCERLGLHVIDVPYAIDNYDIDYDRLNLMLRQNNIKFILLAPSDIIKPFEIAKLDLENSYLLYDISQIMGLIAAGIIENPLKFSDNIVLLGGTHKTLPGPTSGLVLTNNTHIHNMLVKNINPVFLRNPQMHQIISLLFSLMEFEIFGAEYAASIVDRSNLLGRHLEALGFDVAKIGIDYSFTHQVLIRCSSTVMDNINKNGILYGVTLNKKIKPLFNGHGIRLGTQEITRYGWNQEAIKIIALILDEIQKADPNSERINYLKSILPSKTIMYTFPDEITETLISILHKG